MVELFVCYRSTRPLLRSFAWQRSRSVFQNFKSLRRGHRLRWRSKLRPPNLIPQHHIVHRPALYQNPLYRRHRDQCSIRIVRLNKRPRSLCIHRLKPKYQPARLEKPAPARGCRSVNRYHAFTAHQIARLQLQHEIQPSNPVEMFAPFRRTCPARQRIHPAGGIPVAHRAKRHRQRCRKYHHQSTRPVDRPHPRTLANLAHSRATAPSPLWTPGTFSAPLPVPRSPKIYSSSPCCSCLYWGKLPQPLYRLRHNREHVIHVRI